MTDKKEIGLYIIHEACIINMKTSNLIFGDLEKKIMLVNLYQYQSRFATKMILKKFHI